MPWNHSPDCLYGLKAHLPYWSNEQYFVVPFYKCKWWCEGMAWHRLQQVGKEAIALETELTLEFHSQSFIETLRKQALRQGKGYFSLSLSGVSDKLVVASPQLLSTSSQSAKSIIIQTAQLAIPIGITRLNRAKIWRTDEPSGHIPLSIPPIADKARLDRALEKVGMKHGRIYPPRPVAVLEKELLEVLGMVDIEW